jgi:hypothetical protein
VLLASKVKAGRTINTSKEGGEALVDCCTDAFMALFAAVRLLAAGDALDGTTRSRGGGLLDPLGPEGEVVMA